MPRVWFFAYKSRYYFEIVKSIMTEWPTQTWNAIQIKSCLWKNELDLNLFREVIYPKILHHFKISDKITVTEFVKRWIGWKLSSILALFEIKIGSGFSRSLNFSLKLVFFWAISLPQTTQDGGFSIWDVWGRPGIDMGQGRPRTTFLLFS